GLDDIFGTICPFCPAQALVGVYQRPFSIATSQPERSIAVKEVLAVAPEHPTIIGARIANDLLNGLEKRLRLRQPTERQIAIAQVQPGVTSNLSISGLDRVGE